MNKLIFPLVFLITVFCRPVHGLDGEITAMGDIRMVPYEFYNEAGEPDGFSVELLKAVADEVGLSVSIELDEWPVIRKKLETGGIDIITTMFYSETRDRIVDYSIPHYYTPQALFIRKNSRLRSMKDLEGKEIIVLDSFMNEEYLIENNFKGTIIKVNSHEEALRLLEAGYHDAAFLDYFKGLYSMKNLRIRNIRVSTADDINFPNCFALREGAKELQERLNQGLNILMLDGSYDRIYNRWFLKEEILINLYANRVLITVLALLLTSAGATILTWNINLRRKVNRATGLLTESINERKKKEEELLERQQELKLNIGELDFLISEVKLRVVDNLDILSEIASSHLTETERNGKPADSHDFSGRMGAIAELYGRISDSEDHTSVSLEEYIPALISRTSRTCLDKGRISISTEISPIIMRYEKATALGLLTNEAVVNSLKHAFTDGRQGRITVSIRSTAGDRIEVQISDSGTGISRAQLEKPGMGITMISILADQLGAEYRISSEDGTILDLCFSNEPQES